MNRYLIGLFLSAGICAAANWPAFRGPSENGVAEGDAPLEWSDTENVKWKVDVPGKGNSSPVIWGDRIFLTTAIQIGERPKPKPQVEAPAAEEGRRRRRRDTGPQAKHKFVVMCLDKNTGERIWEKTATEATPHEGFHRTYGSFASNPPVTDGKVLIALFGSRGVYAYSLDGELIWKKDFGVQMRMAGTFGEGVPPTLYKETLLLKFDHQGDSFLVALNKDTGEELWRKSRDEVSSWSQPLVVDHEGREQVIVSASGRVRSYDFKTGEVIWECGGLGSNVIPNPVYDGQNVYVMSGHREPNMLAIRMGGTGDLTGTDAVLWTNDRGNSYTPSPVLHDGKLYFLSRRGLLSCFNARTGEAHYAQKRTPVPYTLKASPVMAGGKLYLATENEDVVVVKAGPEFVVLATNKMKDQTFIATPAIVDGEIFLRSTTSLYRIAGRGVDSRGPGD